MLESQRENGLARFPGNRPWLVTEQQFCGLLGDGRAALEATQRDEIRPRRAHDRDWIDAEVLVEAAVFCGQRRVFDVQWDRRKTFASQSVFRERFIQNDTVAIRDRW